MKIGILTFHSVYNYGAVLQAMALQGFLLNLNLGDVELINYEVEDFKKLYSLNPFYGGIKMTLQRLFGIKERYSQAKVFDSFIRDNLLQTRPLQLGELPDYLQKYDAIVYGSDQIWNTVLTQDDGVYFGEYTPINIREISYAASFGTDICNSVQREKIRTYLRKFYRISVRERQGIEYIRKEIDNSVELVVDPVFLLNRKYWETLCENCYPINKPYILYYSLQHNEELINRTNRLAETNNLKIICIHPTARKQRIGGIQLYDVGPIEFLSLIKGAEIICTNSFHAVAFSLILNKKVLQVNHSKSKSRINNLLTLLELNEQEYSEVIDFSKVNVQRLAQIVEDSKSFLKISLIN